MVSSICGSRRLPSGQKSFVALAAVTFLYVVVSMRIVSLSTYLHFLSSKKLLGAYEKVRFVSLVKSVVNIN